MHLRAGKGILKAAAIVDCGSGTVQRVTRDMTCRVSLEAGAVRRGYMALGQTSILPAFIASGAMWPQPDGTHDISPWTLA